MTTNKALSCLILVLEDIEEVRDEIDKLLTADGYRVELARTVEDAIIKAKLQPPDLILIYLPGPTNLIIQAAHQIRQGAELKAEVPIVIFYSEDVAEGEEAAIEGNLYLTRPDNFNQLRAFLRRLLLPH